MNRRRSVQHLMAAALLLVATSANAQTPPLPPSPETPKSEWSFAFTPYAWAIGMYGDFTAKGITTNVSANTIDLLGSTNSLYGFMGNFEARKREYALYLDVVYSFMSGGTSGSVQRTPFPRVQVSRSANFNWSTQLLIAEGAFAFEFLRAGASSGNAEGVSGGWTSAIDAIVGVRYWHAETNASLGVNTNVSLNAPRLSYDASRRVATAATGGMSWADPFIGLRLRQGLAPRHGIDVETDVGGFGVGSQFSWQLRAGYTYQFSTGNVSWAALIGYRALYVNYVNGNGDGLNAVLGGPILGLTAKF
jgi:hypothetical protein